MPLRVERNGSLSFTMLLVDGLDAPVDVTGATFAGKIKAVAGLADPPLASFTITVVDASGGQILVSIIGSTLDAVAGVQETVTLAYDIIAVKDAVPTVLMRGNFFLDPEVTP